MRRTRRRIWYKCMRDGGEVYNREGCKKLHCPICSRGDKMITREGYWILEKKGLIVKGEIKV